MIFFAQGTIGGYSENHTNHANVLCLQNVEFLNAKLGGT